MPVQTVTLLSQPLMLTTILNAMNCSMTRPLIMKIAFVGYGKVGAPLADQLQRLGYDV